MAAPAAHTVSKVAFPGAADPRDLRSRAHILLSGSDLVSKHDSLLLSGLHGQALMQ